MSGLEPLPVATGAAGFAWQPITPAECMTMAWGIGALTLAAWGKCVGQPWSVTVRSTRKCACWTSGRQPC